MNLRTIRGICDPYVQVSAYEYVLLLGSPEIRGDERSADAVSPPPASRLRLPEGKGTMSREYEIHSGRRVVKTVLSSSPLQAAIDYVHTFGSAKEITILGPDTVSWRGARFVGVPVFEENKTG